MMLVTGMVTLVAGVLLAPLLSHGLVTVTTAYRIAFGTLIVGFVGGSFTASLQARDLRLWNVIRIAQPLAGLTAIVMLWWLRRLTLDIALIVIAGTMLLQLVWAYRYCRRTGLAPGHAHIALARPAVGLRHRADRDPGTRNPERPARQTRAFADGPGRRTGPLRDRGLDLPASDAAGHRDRQRHVSPPGGPAR